MIKREDVLLQSPWTRRRVIAGGVCLCCLPSLARAETLGRDFGVQEIAPSVFMRRGVDEEASAANLDGIANVGFIVGDASVLVTETGGSLADGQWLRQKIIEKTDKPIKYVVLSHVHPDHVFGAGAFLDDRPEFIGHHALPAALSSRGNFYRERLIAILGESRAGPLVMPTRLVRDEQQIDLGARVISLKAHPPAHTTTDLSLLDHKTGLFLPADLLFVGRAPSIDGSLTGWISELENMQQMRYEKTIPGHGPVLVDFGAAAEPLLRYLKTLRDGVRAELDGNGSIERAMATVGLSERERWALFDDYNQRNVAEAYKELEWQ
jgi:quinoprotein relay system zinc metallohydrolase 2